MIQQTLAIWSLVPLPFLNLAWTSGSSQFTYCWSLAWRILSMILLACETSAIVQYFEHSVALPFFGIGMKTDLFQSCGHCWVFQICWHTECSTLIASPTVHRVAKTRTWLKQLSMQAHSKYLKTDLTRASTNQNRLQLISSASTNWHFQAEKTGKDLQSVEGSLKFILRVCVCMCSAISLCDPMDCGPPGSSVHGILQARILEWVAILTSRGLPGPEIEPISLASLALNWKVLSRGGTWF